MRVLIPFLFIILMPFFACSQYTQAEKDWGKQVYIFIEKSHGFYENDKLQAFVEATGRRLEAELKEAHHFKYYLIDMAEPNAYATPGGYVFVTRGLLALLNKEDELASILAHEISHVVLKHSKKTIRASMLPMLLKLPANIIGIFTYEELAKIINLPIESSSKLAMKAYSRAKEREADQMGIELTHRAGYNPFCFIDALEHIDKYMDDLYKEEQKQNIFSEHPHTSKRVAGLRKILEKKGLERPKAELGTHILALDGLLFGQNISRGLVQGNAYCHPKIRVQGEFPRNWLIETSLEMVYAQAPDAKSQMILSVDRSSSSPKNAAKREFARLTEYDLIRQSSQRINGLEAFQASFRSPRIKHSDLLYTVTWIKIPVSGQVIKLEGVSPFHRPDTTIAQSMNSFRMLPYEELLDLKQRVIKLIRVKNINDYSFSSMEQRKEVELINNLSSMDSLTDGNYLKVFHDIPLIEN